MLKHSRTKLIPPKMEPKYQELESISEFDLQPNQKEESASTELDNEIECPRCNEIMALCSRFDKLMYSCESCSFLLRCV